MWSRWADWLGHWKVIRSAPCLWAGSHLNLSNETDENLLCFKDLHRRTLLYFAHWFQSFTAMQSIFCSFSLWASVFYSGLMQPQLDLNSGSTYPLNNLLIFSSWVINWLQLLSSFSMAPPFFFDASQFPGCLFTLFKYLLFFLLQLEIDLSPKSKDNLLGFVCSCFIYVTGIGTSQTCVYQDGSNYRILYFRHI